jgi:hypothetical protein
MTTKIEDDDEIIPLKGVGAPKADSMRAMSTDITRSV